MANKSTRYGFRPYGNPPMLAYKPVTTAQTGVIGDPLVLTTAGTISIASASDVSFEGILAEDITTPDALTMVSYYPADLATLWIGQASGSLTYALNGDFVDVEGTTGAFQVNEDAGSTKVIQIVRPYTDEGDAEGTNCLCIFRIVKSSYSGTEIS